MKLTKYNTVTQLNEYTDKETVLYEEYLNLDLVRHVRWYPEKKTIVLEFDTEHDYVIEGEQAITIHNTLLRKNTRISIVPKSPPAP